MRSSEVEDARDVSAGKVSTGLFPDCHFGSRSTVSASTTAVCKRAPRGRRAAHASAACMVCGFVVLRPNVAEVFGVEFQGEVRVLALAYDLALVHDREAVDHGATLSEEVASRSTGRLSPSTECQVIIIGRLAISSVAVETRPSPKRNFSCEGTCEMRLPSPAPAADSAVIVVRPGVARDVASGSVVDDAAAHVVGVARIRGGVDVEDVHGVSVGVRAIVGAHGGGVCLMHGPLPRALWVCGPMALLPADLAVPRRLRGDGGLPAAHALSHLPDGGEGLGHAVEGHGRLAPLVRLVFAELDTSGFGHVGHAVELLADDRVDVGRGFELVSLGDVGVLGGGLLSARRP